MQGMERCCIVSYLDAMKRSIPLKATDRSPQPFTIAPLPLNLTSVRQLLSTYERIVSQSMEGTEDERDHRQASDSSGPAAPPDPASATLSAVGPAATTSVDPTVGDRLLPTGEGAQQQYPPAGGPL